MLILEIRYFEELHFTIHSKDSKIKYKGSIQFSTKQETNYSVTISAYLNIYRFGEDVVLLLGEVLSLDFLMLSTMKFFLESLV